MEKFVGGLWLVCGLLFGKYSKVGKPELCFLCLFLRAQKRDRSFPLHSRGFFFFFLEEITKDKWIK